jgi:hypothetical protein
MKWLERLREKTLQPSAPALTKLTKGASVRTTETFVSFVRASPEGAEVFQGQQVASQKREIDRPTPPMEITAVKVWSDILQAAVWVIADDLPRNERPTDAPVYTHSEVRVLKEVALDTLAWVHITKAMFNAGVVSSTRASGPLWRS